MDTIVNNGARLANELQFMGELRHHQTLDEIQELVVQLTGNDPSCRFMKNDDFWENFIYRAEELGYILKL